MASCCRTASGKLAWPGVPLQGPGLSNATSYTPVEFRPVENPLDPMSLRVTKKRCRLSPLSACVVRRSSSPVCCGARALRRIFWRRSQASLLVCACCGAFRSYKLVPVTKRSFLYICFLIFCFVSFVLEHFSPGSFFCSWLFLFQGYPLFVSSFALFCFA